MKRRVIFGLLLMMAMPSLFGGDPKLTDFEIGQLSSLISRINKPDLTLEQRKQRIGEALDTVGTYKGGLRDAAYKALAKLGEQLAPSPTPKPELSGYPKSMIFFKGHGVLPTTFESEISPEDTVKDLKNRYSLKTGIPADSFRLIFAGKNLEDTFADKKFSSNIDYYKFITSEGTINAVMQKPLSTGGAPTPSSVLGGAPGGPSFRIEPTPTPTPSSAPSSAPAKRGLISFPPTTPTLPPLSSFEPARAPISTPSSAPAKVETLAPAEWTDWHEIIAETINNPNRDALKQAIDMIRELKINVTAQKGGDTLLSLAQQSNRDATKKFGGTHEAKFGADWKRFIEALTPTTKQSPFSLPVTSPFTIPTPGEPREERKGEERFVPAKKLIVDYTSTPQRQIFKAYIDTVAERARAWQPVIEKIIKDYQSSGRPLSQLTVVSDFDDTIATKLFAGGSFDPIEPIVNLLKNLKSRGLNIAIITHKADNPVERKVIADYLASIGVPFDKLVLLPDDQRKDRGTGLWKQRERDKIVNAGQIVPFSFGDEKTDFVGKNTGEIFELPASETFQRKLWDLVEY
jgi:hypothetical protein